jgi:hypothetical protein
MSDDFDAIWRCIMPEREISSDGDDVGNPVVDFFENAKRSGATSFTKRDDPWDQELGVAATEPLAKRATEPLIKSSSRGMFRLVPTTIDGQQFVQAFDYEGNERGMYPVSF